MKNRNELILLVLAGSLFLSLLSSYIGAFNSLLVLVLGIFKSLLLLCLVTWAVWSAYSLSWDL